MIVVDNFRTVLLVGLICTVWISPSFAAMCAGGDPGDCPDGKTLCHINEEGKEGGCVVGDADPECPAGADALKCEDGKGCCCKAGATACNDMADATVKKTACGNTKIKSALGTACDDGMTPTGSPMSSSEGPTGGGGPLPTGGRKCMMKMSGNETTTDVGACDKNCHVNKEGKEFACNDEPCEKDTECGEKTCCCSAASADCTITLSTGNSLASLGSLQVVTLVAAALYFFPIKTSS